MTNNLFKSALKILSVLVFSIFQLELNGATLTVPNPGTKTFESFFSGTITTTSGSTTLSGSTTGGGTNFNDLAVGDVIYAVSGAAYVRIGAVSSIASASSLTLSSSYPSSLSGLTWVAIPKSGTITVQNGGNLTIGFTYPIADSMIVSFVLGSSGKSGSVSFNAPSTTLIPTGFSLAASATASSFTFTDGILKWRETVGNTPPTNITFTYNGGTVMIYPFAPSSGAVNWSGGTFPNLTIVKSSRVYNFTSNVTIMVH
jgi:hypothetical protein